MNLYPYQKEAVDWMLQRTGALNACEVGLGKTIQTLALIERLELKKVLIVCPAILKYQWRDEAARFTPQLKTQVISGGAKERANQWNTPADLYIVNYELLRPRGGNGDWAYAYRWEWDLIVADEATKISNPRAQQSRCVKRLRANRRLAITGTPLSNKVQDIWNIIDFVRPGVFGSYIGFVQRYCLQNKWGGIFGYQNIQELKARLQPHMFRRTVAEVRPQLPPKIISEVLFDLSSLELELYDKLRKELLFEVDRELLSKVENPITIQNTLVKMGRLRQLTDSMELLGESKVSTKLEVLKSLLSDVLKDQKAIVFTQFAAMAGILHRELEDYAPLKITGETHGREQIIKEFNNNPAHCILIMTSAGQFGLNIQSASVVIHYDNEWSLAKLQQREGRAHRIGQERPVLVYHLIARSTIDSYVKKVIYKKQNLSDELIGPGPRSLEEIREILTYSE